MSRDAAPIVLLHVGFPKTATTSLQDHVFAAMRELTNLGKPEMPRRVKKALRRIASEDPERFDPKHVERLRAEVACAARKRRPIVVSHEGMTGSRRMKIGEQSVLRSHGFRALRAQTAERLHRSLRDFDVRVLFTIREQRAWLLSNFADLVLREGLSTELADWLGRGLDAPDDFYADPDFERTIAVYEALWGRDRVGVLAYEEMISDPDRFARSLAGLCELPSERVAERIRSLPRSKTRDQLSDRANPYLAKRENPAKQFTATDVVIPKTLAPELARAVVARCAAGNAAIRTRFGLDLERFGYALVPGNEASGGASRPDGAPPS